MIVTVTPNPLLDYVIHCPEPPAPGGHRVRRLEAVVGGKGINVARMLKTLGKPALALSFCGGPNGEKIRDLLRDEGITARFVPTEAETRVGVNLVVEQPNAQTWWIEDGHGLRPLEVAGMLDLFREWAGKTRFLGLSGTIPGASPRDFYRLILEECRMWPLEVFLDARGEPLREALEVGGFFLKHNRDESRETFGLDPLDPAERPAWVTRLERHRVWGAMVTDGPRPGLLWLPPALTFFTPPPVVEVSAVGSGDACLAGLLYGRVEGMDFTEAVRWGVAAGAADARHPGPCQAGFPEIRDLLPLVGMGGCNG